MAPLLVVDDNAVNRLALATLLKPLGVPCVMVASGDEAVRALETQEFSLVLMDLMMPGIDGFEATRRIRAHEFGTGRRTPIVAVTALDSDTVRDRCLEVGIDDIATKPVDRASIAAQVEKWTTHRVLEGGSDNDEIARLVDTFLSVTRSLLAEIDAAISAHDEPRIRRAVHELKGASLQMKAGEITRLCGDLEAATQKDDAHEMVAVYAALSLAFTRVKTHETKVKSVASLAAPAATDGQ